jgi:hypothetical protein
MFMRELLADNGWRFGLNDSYVSGYVICASYIAVSVLCLYTGFSSKRLVTCGEKKKVILLWGGLALTMLMLGINKQLDLQTLLIAVGRILFKSLGLLEIRREVQAVFAVIFAMVSAVSFLGITWILRTQLLNNKYVFYGIFLISSFIVMRALSINHIELTPVSLPFIARMHLGTIHEIAGIGCIGYGAIRRILGNNRRSEMIKRS